MFGNDLTRADSFGTPRSKPVNAVTAPIRTGAGEQAGLDLIVDGDEQRGELPILRVHVDDENYDLASFDVDETGKPWEYAREIQRRVNNHVALAAALEQVQRFLRLLTDSGELDRIAAERSHPDDVNALCDAVDGTLTSVWSGA
jgi:predicted RNA-binding Zn ribbon-like protein